jgi:hypothetical protein
VVSAALTVVVALGVSSAASAAGSHRGVRVTFVLSPTWLPSGYSTSGGGWISPPGGLRVYPNTGVTESIIAAGSKKYPNVPVLFTLDYYGFHDPESKNIDVTATPAKSPGFAPAIPNATLHHRRVSLYSYTQGALHNLNVDLSWVEDGDAIDVTTQGLPVAQAERFVEGLVKKDPPRHPQPIPAATTTVPTTTVD